MYHGWHFISGDVLIPWNGLFHMKERVSISQNVGAGGCKRQHVRVIEADAEYVISLRGNHEMV